MHPGFETYLLNEDGKARAHALAEAFDELLDVVRRHAASGTLGTPPREVALATTHLEQACFYAKKAMAMQPENQQPGDGK